MHLAIRPSVPPFRALPGPLLMVLMSGLAAGCSVFGVQSVEEAPHELVREDGRFEIRDYAPVVVAETRVEASFDEAGEEAFGRLFAYISGENEASEKIAMTSPVVAATEDGASGEKIAMTAPVTSEKDGEAWRYRFVLPASHSPDSAPRPLNPDVSLAATAKRRVASVRYSGRATARARAANAEALTEWIAAQGLTPLSAPRWAGYDAPWTLPPFRRNEVLIDVAER